VWRKGSFQKGIAGETNFVWKKWGHTLIWHFNNRNGKVVNPSARKKYLPSKKICFEIKENQSF